MVRAATFSVLATVLFAITQNFAKILFIALRAPTPRLRARASTNREYLQTESLFSNVNF